MAQTTLYFNILKLAHRLDASGPGAFDAQADEQKFEWKQYKSGPLENGTPNRVGPAGFEPAIYAL